MIRRMIAFLLSLLLLFSLTVPAAAEDVFTIDVDLLDMDRLTSDDYVERELSSGAQGVRVRKYISQSSELAAPVRLTLTQMDSRTLLFDKDYGFQSGTFDSGVIYLPYVSGRTAPYLVTLYVGDYVYAMPYMHRQARLSHNGACTYGVRLRDLSSALGSDWLMGTMVDLNALCAQGSRTVEVVASNSCVIGQATLTMSGGRLRVDLAFDAGADVEMNQLSLYVITDVKAYLSGRHTQSYGVSEWIDVSGCNTALIYLPMQLSYDPAGLPAFRYDLQSAELQNQLRLWQQLSGGTEGTEAHTPDDDWNSGWSDGWSGDGWSDDGWNEGGGWDDGWNSSADGWMDDPSGGW